jgi:type IV pilus assembly protein PilA
MTDWYYHAPGQGRVGPLSVEQMRQSYRERRIDRETLVWHDGLREWQPVGRMIEALGLSDVQPDASMPPPVPPPRPAAGSAAQIGQTRPSATTQHAGPTRPASAPPPTNRTGCIIALVVVAIVGLVLVAILAAIALPAYQDYVKRSKAAQSGQPAQRQERIYTFDSERMADTDALARELTTAAMREFYVANGNVCPDTFEFEKMMVRYPRYQGSEDDGWFGIDPAQPISGTCAYRVRFYGLGPEVMDKTVQYDVNLVGDEATVYCRNIDLPAGFAPPRCGT